MTQLPAYLIEITTDLFYHLYIINIGIFCQVYLYPHQTVMQIMRNSLVTW